VTGRDCLGFKALGGVDVAEKGFYGFGFGEEEGEGVCFTFEFLPQDVPLILVVGAFKEVVADGFDSETLAVWACWCFRPAYSEEVLI
jgi:hypothetical protein